MAIRDIPAQGANWLGYAQDIDAAVRGAAAQSSLSTVATSGSYNDLTNKPSIPTVVDASDTAKGIIELATTAEAITGTDTVRAVTPAGLKAAADTKAPLASPTFTGTVSGVTKAMVGLGNVDNTSDANKPVSTAQQTALNAKASLGGGNTFSGAQRINGQFSTNTAADAKQPIAMAVTMNGPDIIASGSTHDKVAMAQAITVSGNFTGDTGSNVGFLWGQNVFLVTGTSPGDGAGISSLVGSLIETAVGTPAGTTYAVVRGLEAHASFFGAAAGATVTLMESLRVSAPSRKDGATAGTATNVYGLFVEAVTGAAVGATGSVFSLFVAGGTSRFGGRVDVTDQIANNGSNDLQLFAGFSSADGGYLQVQKNANGGNVRARMATANAEFQVHDNAAVTWSVSRTGLPKWNAAGNAQTTVGAAGGASALPATPTKYLKIVDSAGTTLVIPAYAAA